MSLKLLNIENRFVYSVVSLCERKGLKEKVGALTQLAGCVGLPSQGAAGGHVEQG